MSEKTADGFQPIPTSPDEGYLSSLGPEGGPGDGEPSPQERTEPPPPPTFDAKEWSPPRGQLGQIHETLTVILGGVSAMFLMGNDIHCYTVFQQRGPVVAQALTQAAEKNPQLKAALLRLTIGGAYGEILFASASLIIPVMDHHGLWPLPNPWALIAASPTGDQDAGATAAAMAQDVFAVDDNGEVHPPADMQAEMDKLARHRAATANRGAPQ